MKLSPTQQRVIDLMHDNLMCVSTSNMFRGNCIEQPSGRHIMVSASTFEALLDRKLIEHFRGSFPVAKYRLTELGKQHVRKEASE